MGATELESLVVRLTGDASSYLKMLKEAGERTKQEADQIQGLTSKIEGFMNKASQGLASLGAMAWLKKGLANFQEAEQIGTQLTATLIANGREVEALKADYEEWAIGLEKVTSAEDDHLLKLVGVAETYKLTGDAAKKAVEDAMAFAKITGKGSEEGMLRLTAALATGNMEAAKLAARPIKQLRGIQDPEEFRAEAERLIAAGNKAIEMGRKTSAEQMEILKRDYGNLTEEFGKFTAQGIAPAVAKLTGLVAWFRRLSDGTKETTTYLVAMTAGLVAMNVILPLVGRNLLALATNPFAWAVVAVVAIIELGKYIVSTAESTKMLNEALKDNAKAIEGLKAASNDKGKADIERVMSMGGTKDQIDNFSTMIEANKKELDEKRRLLIEAKQDLYVAQSSDPNASIPQRMLQGFEKIVGEQLNVIYGAAEQVAVNSIQAELDILLNLNKQYQEQKDKLTGKKDMGQTAEEAKKLREDIDAKIKLLHEEADLYGLVGRAADLAKLKLLDVNKANVKGIEEIEKAMANLDMIDRRNKQTEEAEAIRQKYRTPMQHFQEQKLKLDSLFRAGKIDAELYAKAIDGVAQSLFKAAEGQDAVLAGSGEALKRMAAYGEMLTRGNLAGLNINLPRKANDAIDALQFPRGEDRPGMPPRMKADERTQGRPGGWMGLDRPSKSEQLLDKIFKELQKMPGIRLGRAIIS